jgi:demethylmenaquinone methyltransferase/2-methoxy-6-polyprenyl-1,4-benzoquinol methylase
LAEALRVLKSGGRLGVVSMALVRPGERDSALESVYKWMHRHFPHLVDCRPIDPAAEMKQGGFQIASEERMEIWTMPVAAVVGRKPG